VAVDINALAPGARVLIRDAEWIVKRKDRTSVGDYSLQVVGVSEIVRGQEARFLTSLEDKSIVPLDPAQTDLVADTSPQYRHSRLYLESLLRQSPPTDSDLWIGHQAAIDDLPYQLDPAIQALEQSRQRILMADATGLGKTIEIGILLSELIRRGKGRRILVVATKSMLAQFQKEMWARFTIPLVRLDSLGLDRIRTRIPTNANPFHYYDKAIISIDTLKQNNEYRVYLEKSYWDIIVIDEAQNVAIRGAGKSLRARLAELLSTHSDTLIMASATPHDGRPESFASLMNMLNPMAIANPKDYGPDDIRGLFLRRFKRHVLEHLTNSFQDRRTTRHQEAASAAEERAYGLLAGAQFHSFDRARRPGQLLFKTVLEKSIFSSPAACLATVKQRLKKLENTDSAEATADRRTLLELQAALEAITPDQFSKYQTLLRLLRKGGEMGWNPRASDDRLVIFTERIETLNFLREHLPADLNLKDKQVQSIQGTAMSDTDIQEIVENFGRDAAPIRLLLASDIASEGLNLHYLSHKLIHFDIPWSLMIFQQRNGRIDRYGQEREPHIAYLLTQPEHPDIRGDLRILERLMEKDAQAAKNIGDPSVFLGIFDSHDEEVMTGKAIEENMDPDVFERRMDETARNELLTILTEDTAVADGSQTRRRCQTPASLFDSDFDFLREALASLESQNGLQAAFDPSRQLISLNLGNDLKRTFDCLPREAYPDHDRLHLTSDRQLVKDAIRRARAEENSWPDVQLLWDLHPVVEWLTFKLLVLYQRRQAPVLRLAGVLDPGEAWFLIQAEIPNRKGQPVIHDWFAVGFNKSEHPSVLSLNDFLDRTQFHRRLYPNAGQVELPVSLAGLLPEAVRRARDHMAQRRQAFKQAMDRRLAAEIDTLRRLRESHVMQLELDFPEGPGLGGVQRNRREQRRRRIEDVFRSYQAWVEDTMTTEDRPFIRVAAVFIG